MSRKAQNAHRILKIPVEQNVKGPKDGKNYKERKEEEVQYKKKDIKGMILS